MSVDVMTIDNEVQEMPGIAIFNGMTTRGMVYVIQGHHDAPVKIGYVSHPDNLTARVATLQIGNHVPLTVIAMGAGSQQDEKMLHKAFAEERLIGEWFTFSERVQLFVSRLRVQPLRDAMDFALSSARPSLERDEWRDLVIHGSGAIDVFQIRPMDLLYKAAKSGWGPPVYRAYTVNKKGAQTRYYKLSDLHSWLRTNNIPHAIRKDLWGRFVVPIASLDGPETLVA